MGSDRPGSAAPKSKEELTWERGFLGPIENVPIWELGGHGVERGLVVVGFTLLSCPEASQCTCHCLPTTHPTTTTTADISIDFSRPVVSINAHINPFHIDCKNKNIFGNIMALIFLKTLKDQ